MLSRPLLALYENNIFKFCLPCNHNYLIAIIIYARGGVKFKSFSARMLHHIFLVPYLVPFLVSVSDPVFDHVSIALNLLGISLLLFVLRSIGLVLICGGLIKDRVIGYVQDKLLKRDLACNEFREPGPGMPISFVTAIQNELMKSDCLDVLQLVHRCSALVRRWEAVYESMTPLFSSRDRTLTAFHCIFHHIINFRRLVPNMTRERIIRNRYHNALDAHILPNVIAKTFPVHTVERGTDGHSLGTENNMFNATPDISFLYLGDAFWCNHRTGHILDLILSMVLRRYRSCSHRDSAPDLSNDSFDPDRTRGCSLPRPYFSIVRGFRLFFFYDQTLRVDGHVEGKADGWLEFLMVVRG
ncbi:hypothetical protein E6O75_ATG10550 [Venturia nashicola]|uniref:Uncharacterized protein n=1 Tax=Venturia nashicola TaxID=86259 RepID=A0A4Z1P989_9PEZI|nr:hypothetical protein E6O75_ATG10550 [Venturia nashicola]